MPGGVVGREAGVLGEQLVVGFSGEGRGEVDFPLAPGQPQGFPSPCGRGQAGCSPADCLALPSPHPSPLPEGAAAPQAAIARIASTIMASVKSIIVS